MPELRNFLEEGSASINRRKTILNNLFGRIEVISTRRGGRVCEFADGWTRFGISQGSTSQPTENVLTSFLDKIYNILLTEAGHLEPIWKSRHCQM